VTGADEPGRSGPADERVSPVSSASATPDNVDPLTLSAMGKLFGIPLLIIAVIVGGAIAVVLLFGAPAAVEERGVEDLLVALESGSGERSMGVLLPREKELWQTALELSERLKKKEKGLTEEQVQSIAIRLGGMVRADLANLDRLPTLGSDREKQREVRSKRLEFVILALGRTGRAEAIGPLIDIIRSGDERFAIKAMQQLGNLHELPAAKEAIEPILDSLEKAAIPETRLMACTVLSVVAEPGEQRVVDALSTIRLSHEGEVAWSAALSLARLGSSAGKTTLLDLLDRSFLEGEDRYQTTDAAGTVHRSKLQPDRIDQLLIAAMEAASHLSDPELWGQIERLASDRSPPVRGRAVEILKRRP